jgi:hypothetical protein
MAEKYITSDGKKMLLRLGFIPNESTSTFNYVALGVNNSNMTTQDGSGVFEEASGFNYTRAPLVEESGIDVGEHAIAVSATFDSTNYNPSAESVIKEIGIVNQSDNSSTDDIFFAFAKVPEIDKSHNVSLKYTIILEIE